MAIYTVGGTALHNAYDFNESQISKAYDVSQTPLILFSLMTYNVQWFTGINSQVAMQSEIINSNAPEVIGFQEFAKTKAVPSVGQQVLGDYPSITLSDHVNYLAVASKLGLYDIMIADFVNQDPEDMSRYGETRAYIKGYFDFFGKKICIINTHFALTNSYIYLQMGEIFNLAELEEYVVITGDFNTWFSDFDSEIYQNTFKQFVDAGYKLVNNAPSIGITNTFSNLTNVTALSDMRSNPDSIIVSGNMDIFDHVFDTTKFRYLDGNVIDHIAINARLIVN